MWRTKRLGKLSDQDPLQLHPYGGESWCVYGEHVLHSNRQRCTNCLQVRSNHARNRVLAQPHGIEVTILSWRPAFHFELFTPCCLLTPSQNAPASKHSQHRRRPTTHDSEQTQKDGENRCIVRYRVNPRRTALTAPRYTSEQKASAGAHYKKKWKK